MIAKGLYRGVLFGVYALPSPDNGTTVVRPLAVMDRNLAGLLSGVDIRKCVGKAHKVDADDNSDAYGVHQSCCRCYRMVIGMAKIKLDHIRRGLDEMQKQSRNDQDRMQNARYPKAPEKKGLVQRVKGALVPKQLPAKKNGKK
jgi:hypothetical protein